MVGQNLISLTSRTRDSDLFLQLGGIVSIEEDIALYVTVVGPDCCHAISQTANFLLAIRAHFLVLVRLVLHVPNRVCLGLKYKAQLRRGKGQILLH